MTSEWLGERFEGDSADTRAEKIPLVPIGVRADSPACAGRGARPPSALAEFDFSSYVIHRMTSYMQSYVRSNAPSDVTKMGGGGLGPGTKYVP